MNRSFVGVFLCFVFLCLNVRVASAENQGGSPYGGQRPNRPDHQQIIEDGGQTIINNYYYGTRPAPVAPPASQLRQFTCTGVCQFSLVTSVIGSYSYIAPTYDRKQKSINVSTQKASLAQAEAWARDAANASCSDNCRRSVPRVSQYIHQSHTGCRVRDIQCR